MSAELTPAQPAARRLPARRDAPSSWQRLLSQLPTSRLRTARAAYEHARLATTSDELARLVAHGANHRWRYSARAVALIGDRNRAALQRGIEVAGLAHLSAATRTGNGTILVSTHLSDFDLGGSWLAQVCGHEVVAVVGGPCPRLRAKAFNYLRRRCGIIIRRQESTSIGDLCEDVALGRIVNLMLDRRPNAAGVELSFLGRPAVMSPAPLALARRTGATVLVVGLKATETGGHLMRISPAAPVPPYGDGVAWLQSVADQLADLVQWAPDQWHIPPALSQLVWT